MTSWDNPYGKPSFYDLDESWLEYMKADRKQRIKMIDDTLNTESIVIGVFAIAGVILAIIGLASGWL